MPYQHSTQDITFNSRCLHLVLLCHMVLSLAIPGFGCTCFICQTNKARGINWYRRQNIIHQHICLISSVWKILISDYKPESTPADREIFKFKMLQELEPKEGQTHKKDQPQEKKCNFSSCHFKHLFLKMV